MSKPAQFGGDRLYLHPRHPQRLGDPLLPHRPPRRTRASRCPTTWAEYLAAAEALTSGDVKGSVMVGPADRADRLPGRLVHPVHHDGWPDDERQQGRRDAAHQPRQPGRRRGAPEPDRPRARSRPSESASYGFTEALDQFLVGKVAMWPTWSTIAGALFGPDSPVADTVAVAPMPADDGNPRAVRGGWGLGIPANLSQEEKDCAWHILTQITSKDVREVPGPELPDRPEPHLHRGWTRRSSRHCPYIPAAVECHRERPDPGVRQHSRDVRDRRRRSLREINLALSGPRTQRRRWPTLRLPWTRSSSEQATRPSSDPSLGAAHQAAPGRT